MGVPFDDTGGYDDRHELVAYNILKLGVDPREGGARYTNQLLTVEEVLGSRGITSSVLEDP